MTVKETLMADMKAAMKEKKMEELTTLRSLISVLKNKALEKRTDEISDEDAIAALTTEAKKRKESIQVFEEAGRKELAATEIAELEIINRYLPELMSEEAARTEVKRILEAEKPADFGQAMQKVMAELKGKAGAKMLSQIVKEMLG
ncbi:MAG: GatB/YqeY domain-containing protein [Candidatus Paceibacterota bacterium]